MPDSWWGSCYKQVRAIDVSRRVRSEDSIRSVLDWYRHRLMHERFGKRFLPVPASIAGWVLAAPGEPFERDGTRPLGAVRDDLFDLFDKAGLGERERLVLSTRFGLTEYPAHHPVRRLGERLPMLRERGSDGVSARRLRDLVADAVRGLDRAVAEHGLEREGTREVYPTPVTDPVDATWFRDRVPLDDQPLLFERAVLGARMFASVAGVDAEVASVLDEIDAYHAEVTSGAWPAAGDRPRGRSRARALVSLALWDVLGARGEVVLAVEPARTGVMRAPPAWLPVILGEALGAFLAGDWSDEVVGRACSDALALAGEDSASAGIACDLLLGAYGKQDGRRLSEDAAALVLRTAVRVRAADDDPTAVALALRAYADRPSHWLTVDTLQAAVKVASACGCYTVAQELCDRADSVLDGNFSVPAGRDIAVERVEYRLFNHHQRTGTLRRLLDDGAGTPELERAMAEQDAAERDCLRAYELARSGAPSDARERWVFWLAIRAAEIRLILLRRRFNGQRLRDHLGQIEVLLERAATAAADERSSGRDYVPLIKVKLALALATSEPEEAAMLLGELHRFGWPLSRTLPEIVAIVQPTRLRARAPERLRQAVDEIRLAEREPAWRARAAAEHARGWRQARARQLVG